MKTAVVIDFDTRRVLFQKIVESLKLFPSMESWDLTWGEPFLAVTKDRRVWVRIFYEESVPASIEKLKGEVERLVPHLKAGGELILCLPQSRAMDVQDIFLTSSMPVRIWSYSGLESGSVLAREIEKKPVGRASVPVAPVDLIRTPLKLDQRLSSAEVRELAQMGLDLKRFDFKQAS